MTSSFDLLVLGGGPGGYVAALRGAQLGLKVCLVENEFLGGVCLNKGCIPSKTLLAGTEFYSKLEKASDWGIELGGTPRWNARRLFEKKDEVVLKMRQGLEVLCEKRKVFRVNGFGRFISPTQVQVGKEIYSASKLILATGSSAKRIDLGIKDNKKVLTSEEALSLQTVPGSLLILGGGPEGCEFALVFRGLGCRVLLVETQDRLLPGMDRDAGSAIRRTLIAKGVEVFTADSLLKAAEAKKGIEFQLKSGKSDTVDAVLLSVGRIANTSGMGLEALGVSLNEKKAVATDASLKTKADSIYAIGDVTGKLMMAHAASYEGYMTAARLAGKTKEALDYSTVPSVVYTYPEVAEVGLNEEKAAAQNIPYEIGRFSFAALGRAHAKAETEGFVKIIGHAKTNKVLGGVIVGDGASDLINMISLAVKHGLGVADLRSHTAPHPSASEAVVEAAHLFFKEGLHYA